MEHVSIEVSRPSPSGYAGGPDLWYDDIEITYEQFLELTNKIECLVDAFLQEKLGPGAEQQAKE